MENFWNDILTFLKTQGISILLAIITLFLGLLAVKICKKLITRFLQKKHIDESRISFTISIIDVLLKIVVIFLTLSVLNVDTTSLLAIVSTCGVAIGLALKDSLSNIASGIIIMYNSPFKQGDYIDVNNNQGSVLNINLFTTTLKSVDNKKIIMPNSMVLNNSLTNFNSMPLRRIDLIIKIAANNNFENVKNIILDILNGNNLILKNPQSDVLIENFIDGNIEVLIKVWVKTENYWKVYYFITQKIFEKFNQNNICFPYKKIDFLQKKWRKTLKNH